MKEHSIIKVSKDICKEIYDTLTKLHYKGLELSNLEYEVHGQSLVEPKYLCLNVLEKKYEWLSDADDFIADSSIEIVKRYKSWKHFVPLLQGRVKI